MSNWNVLVIDDEGKKSEDPKGRYQKYNKLSSQQYDSRGFRLTFARDTDHARIMLKQQSNNYDIVLLDVRLTGWGDDSQGTDFKELFRLASERYLVALVSAHWDHTSMDLVRDILLHNPDIDQPLFFTFKDFETGGLAAIGTQIITFIRRKRSLYSLEIQPKSPFHILHLSDFHFGSEGTEKTLASTSKIDDLCNKIKAEWPQGPHIIAVTGDIGNTGHPDDYKIALEWFMDFTERLGIRLPSPRLLLVPGNHDVSIPLAGAQQLFLKPIKKGSTDKKQLYLKKPDDKQIKLNPLTAYASQPYCELATKVSSTTGAWHCSPAGYWTEFGFAEYGVVFSGFNTSKRIGTDSWPLRQIDDEDTNQVINSFKEKGLPGVDNGILHISLSHHSPVAYPSVREPVDTSDIFMNNFLRTALAPRLFLHGHQHRRWGAMPDGTRYMVIGAPSPGAVGQPIDTPRGVNMLSLERVGSCVKKIMASSLIYLEPGWTPMNLPNTHEFELVAAE